MNECNVTNCHKKEAQITKLQSKFRRRVMRLFQICRESAENDEISFQKVQKSMSNVHIIVNYKCLHIFSTFLFIKKKYKIK